MSANQGGDMARTVILPTLAHSSSSSCWWYFLANLMNSHLPTSSPNLSRFWLTRGLILTQHAGWQGEILTHGGHWQDGSRSWYGGKTLPDGSVEEFNEDCSMKLGNLVGNSPHAERDQAFAYADVDIDHISTCLGIRWEASKSVRFGEEVPYLGFC